jgi:hypothetical protein
MVICEPCGEVSRTCENILQTKTRRLTAVNVGELTDADDLVEGIDAISTFYESIFSKIIRSLHDTHLP